MTDLPTGEIAALEPELQRPAPTDRWIVERRTPEARSATWLAAVLVLIAVFASGLIIGQNGGLGGPAQSVATPGSPGLTAAPGGSAECDKSVPQGVVSLPAEAPDDFNVFWQALACIRENYVGRDGLQDSDLTYGAIRGMVQALGDTGHSTFLTPEALAGEQSSLSGTVVGVGALLGTKDGKPVIVSVLSGGPASRAGMHSGDEILAVNGEDVTALEPDEVASRIRGEAGTTVVVKVSRPSTNEEIEFSMVREQINFPAASWAFINGTHIADLRLIQFSTGAADELRAARDEAIAAGATAFVLDLRSNPGGYVSEAIRVASEFIGSKTVYIRELADGSRIPVGTCNPTDNPGRTGDCRDQDSGPATDLPLVVLIDQGTASAAEIVSGALRSAGRGELVGATTFGTGTVLLTYTLSDGSAVRIAVERWLTPDGELIFGHGIQPTTAVTMPANATALEPQEAADLTPAALAGEDPQIAKALEILRAAGAQ